VADETDRLSKIEKDVEELKQGLRKTSEELSRTVEELKKAIVDIRSAITDIENPFNLLRVITSEQELQQARKAAEMEAAAKEEVKPAEKPVEEAVEAPAEAPPEKPVLEVAKVIAEAKPIGFETGFSIIKWVWYLLDAGFEAEDVLNLSKYCESVGYLPPKSSQYVNYVVDAMSKARLGGLTLEEFLLIIYGAAKTSGLKLEMKELEEIAFTLLRKILKKVNVNYEGKPP